MPSAAGTTPNGVRARTKPEEGLYAEGMMIVVGEQGEIDVSGRSLGLVYVKDKEVRKKELIAEIISHFSL